jgi:GYF domain 2
MASRRWFIGRNGRQEGPYPDERLRELIASGVVTAETLVWTQGMTNWAKAAEVPGLMTGAPRPPSVAPGAGPADGHATGALSANVGVWSLLGRMIVAAIAQITIIPAPWVLPSFYRWFVDQVEFPGHQRVTFEGKPGDIWYIFILNSLVAYSRLIHKDLPLLFIPLSVFFTFIILRWFLRNLAWQGQSARLAFVGSYWILLGWYLLLFVSIFSIIGWAWVTTAWIRWISRNISGARRQLVFTASGWSYLWRTLVVIVGCVFIIPIPWTLWWFTRWLVSQFALIERAEQNQALQSSPQQVPAA